MYQRSEIPLPQPIRGDRHVLKVSDGGFVQDLLYGEGEMLFHDERCHRGSARSSRSVGGIGGGSGDCLG